MIHIFLAAVFNHIFVHLQALLREKYSDMRILLTTHPIIPTTTVMTKAKEYCQPGPGRQIHNWLVRITIYYMAI